MAFAKIIVFGDKNIGKTQLINRLIGQEYNSIYKTTTGMNFFTIKKEGLTLQFWDSSGDEQYKSLNKNYYNKSQIGLYCIDLSNEINTLQINNDIKEFKAQSPDAQLLLIGTKGDSFSTIEEAKNKLANIDLEGID